MHTGTFNNTDINHNIIDYNHYLFRITEHCAESFILRLIRLKSKTCFIKVFSGKQLLTLINYPLPDKPELFNNIQVSMKFMYQRQLTLYPRFHNSIDSFLDKSVKPNLIELRIPLSKNMKLIQSSIMECIHQSLNELKRLNPFVIPPIYNIIIKGTSR